MDLQIKIISQNSESKYKAGNKYLKRSDVSGSKGRNAVTCSSAMMKPHGNKNDPLNNSKITRDLTESSSK